MTRAGARLAVACALGAVLGPASAHAAPRDAVRHEYLPPEVLLGATDALSTMTTIEGTRAPGELPESLTRDGERLPAPPEGRADSPQVADGARPGPKPADAILRPDRARPDRETGVDADLTYHAVYNPEVAPLRRNVAFNEVGPGPDYEMAIRPAALVPVPLTPGTPGPGREAFWGDLRLDLTPGVPAPVPSVAPDMRLLAMRTEPETDAVFLRDSGDNYYLRATGGGPVRVVFLVDADRRYFAGPVPGNVPIGALGRDPDAALAEAARRAAAPVLEKLGVTPDLPFDRGVARLIAYFRAFVAGPLVDGPGDLYLDLAMGGMGVCRHRAFAFIVTARAAGVPTRYVQNEAHAFVEIKVPDGTWRRVDLGGQAPNLDIQSSAGGRLHTPPPDAFPKPESYLSSYSAQLLRGQGSPTDAAGRPKPGALRPMGPGARSKADPNSPRSEIPIPGSFEPGGPGGPGGPGAGGDAGIAMPGMNGPLRDAGPGSFLSGPAAPTAAPLRPTRLTLEAGGGEVYRGEELPFQARGRLRSAEGEAVSGVRVQVFLVPVDGGEALAVGTPVRTGSDGGFDTRLRLPQTLPLGRYRLLAVSETDAGFAPARSDAP